MAYANAIAMVVTAAKDAAEMAAFKLRGRREDWSMPFEALHAEHGVLLQARAEQMRRLQETAHADRLLLESLPKLDEVHSTDPPFVARAAIFVVLSQRLIKNVLGTIGRWGNNPTKQLVAVHEAQERLEYLMGTVLSSGPSLVRSEFARSGAQVAMSHLQEDLGLATGMDLTILRLERSADFNVLSLFARQLQAHQTLCEEQAEHVFMALQAVRAGCEKLKLEEGRKDSSMGEAEASGKPLNMSSSGVGLSLSSPLASRQRKSYQDNMSTELEEMSQQLNLLKQRLEKLEGTISTVKVEWGPSCALPQSVAAAAASSGAALSGGGVVVVGGGDEPVAVLDDDLRFWLQCNGYLVRYQGAFLAGGFQWREVKNITLSMLKDVGVNANDARRIVKLFAQEDLYRAWENVVVSGWLKKRGKVNKGWRQRYCVLLTNMELLYYKSEVADKPQDSILLRRVQNVSAVADDLRILLHTATRTYELMAPSHALWTAWLRLFNLMTR